MVTLPKIKLYAIPQNSHSTLTGANDLLELLSLSLDYDQSEFRLLEQSVLSHDLFLNKTSPDTVGKIINLAGAGTPEALHIQFENLPKILHPLEKIYSLVQNQGKLPINIETLIYNFLIICHRKNCDVISVSQLSWNYGD